MSAKAPEPVWSVDPTIDDINRMGLRTMPDHLGIRFVEVGPDFMRAEMPVSDRTKQPFGILHGGASAALAETVASVAGWYCVDQSAKVVVGIELNVNHIRSKREGTLTATARPLHLGRTTQVWEVRINDEEGRLVAISRMTAAVVDRR